LGNLEERAADPITIADTHCIVGQSFDREVLAELTMDEVSPLQLFLPMTIRFDLVNKDCALLASVTGEVTLTVSIQIQPANPTAVMHRIFPDPSVHSTSVPLDISWKPNVYR
jgi:hypothetical protein